MLCAPVSTALRLPSPLTGLATVVLVHGSLSDRRFWRGYRGLFTRSADIDLIGYGSSAPWPGSSCPALSDEAERLRGLLLAQVSPCHVVAHSYGAAVALRLAVETPELVASLTLVEPVCFQILEELGEEGAAARAEIGDVAGDVAAAIAAGDLDGASRRFVDYWNGPGAWQSLGVERREKVAPGIVQVARNFAAIAGEGLRLADYRRCFTPTLVVGGDQSPAPARHVASALAAALPQGALQVIAGAGHMLPLTHAEAFAALLSRRLWFCLAAKGLEAEG